MVDLPSDVDARLQDSHAAQTSGFCGNPVSAADVSHVHVPLCNLNVARGLPGCGNRGSFTIQLRLSLHDVPFSHCCR